MSEIALLSNQSSSLYASSVAGSSADQSEYVYDMDRSSVNKFKSRMTRVRINNPAFGGQVSVEIPSFGILTKMVLRTRITLNSINGGDDSALAAADVAKAIGAMMIDRVSLMNSSREIQTLYGDCIQYLIYNMPADEKKKWLAAMGDDAGAPAGLVNTDGVPITFAQGEANRSIDIYTLLPFSCFHEGGAGTPYKSCFNTRFIEKLNCTIKFADVGAAGGFTSSVAHGFSGVVTLDTNNCELLCDFDVLEQKSLNKVEEANYSLSQPLAQVMSNWALTKKSKTFGAGDTKMNINLFNTQLAHSIVIVVDRKDATGLGHGAAGWQAYGTGRHVALKGIKLSSAGRVLYEATTVQECAYIGSTDNGLGNCWGTYNAGAHGADKFYVIPFGNLLRDTSAIKGCCALKNLNSLELEVDIVGAGNNHIYELKAYCRFYQATATQSNTGRISISLSS